MPITSTVHCFALKSKWLVKTEEEENVRQVRYCWNEKRATEMESQSQQQKVRVQRMIAMMEMMVKKWKEEERESFRDAAAAREAFIQKQVDSLQSKLVMEKEY